jgi:hypothetical protein
MSREPLKATPASPNSQAMGNDRAHLRGLLIAAFGFVWVIVLAIASRPSQQPEILDWWSARAAAVWTAAVCGLILLSARLRWLLGPRGTQLIETLFRGLRSSAALWAFSASAPLLVGAAALAWLRIMSVPFDMPLLTGLMGAAGLAITFELLLASAGRKRRSVDT